MATSGLLLAIRPQLPNVIAERLLGGWHMFPTTIEYVMATIGMAMFLFGLGHRFIDRETNTATKSNWRSITKTFSRYSFTIYVLHHCVHIWPMWIYAMAQQQEPTYYWRTLMPLEVSLLLAVLFLVACFFALRKVGPDRRLGVEGWMRWLCD